MGSSWSPGLRTLRIHPRTLALHFVFNRGAFQVKSGVRVGSKSPGCCTLLCYGSLLEFQQVKARSQEPPRKLAKWEFYGPSFVKRNQKDANGCFSDVAFFLVSIFCFFQKAQQRFSMFPGTLAEVLQWTKNAKTTIEFLVLSNAAFLTMQGDLEGGASQILFPS